MKSIILCLSLLISVSYNGASAFALEGEKFITTLPELISKIEKEENSAAKVFKATIESLKAEGYEGEYDRLTVLDTDKHYEGNPAYSTYVGKYVYKLIDKKGHRTGTVGKVISTATVQFEMYQMHHLDYPHSYGINTVQVQIK